MRSVFIIVKISVANFKHIRVIPVLTIAAFAALGLFRYGMVTQVIVLLECCPAASITSVFAVQFHHDEQFAAGSVVLTTLLSIVFLPLCALIITMF